MYSYSVYGLIVHSQIQLSELLCKWFDVPDVTVQIGKVDLYPAEEGFAGGCFMATADNAYFHWPEYGTCSVRNGNSIIVEPAIGAEERILRLMILGPAIGVLLHQRGILTLHASAVCIHGGVVAFLAEKRGGKSTTAASLHVRGHAVVADDIVAIDTDRVPLRVIPGEFQMKIEPRVADALGENVEKMVRIHPNLSKVAYRTTVAITDLPLYLTRVYVLRNNRIRSIRKLAPQDVFRELLRHSYAVRFLGDVGATPDHFLRIMKLANEVPVFLMERPDAIDELSEFARWIEHQNDRLSEK